ncbi:hypothetical protein DV735_g403, partial [Chaetothyriales sp. CBS 134920]
MSLRRSARVLGSAVEPLAHSHVAAPTSSRKRTGEDSATPQATKRSKTSRSSASEQEPNGSQPVFKKPEPPVTPVRKRRAAPADTSSPVTAPPLPLTPTPSLVNLIRASRGRSGANGNGALDMVEDRLVGPSVTNAVLVTPGGTRKVAFPRGEPEPSPSKSGLSRPVATTSSLLEEACAHLIRVDPRMKGLIDKHHCSIFSAEGLAEEIDPFRSLCSGIIGQQVSGAAARSIRDKFVTLFNDEPAGQTAKGDFPTPAQVAGTDIAHLRLAGLSQRKAEYIQGLAQKFRDGELSADMLMTASDEQVMEKLIAVRGLGKWSVEMFACFGLKRMDILSTGDLGVQRGMAAYFGKDVKKLKAKGGGKWKYMSEQDMLDKSAKYAPYRSLFMWYMWRVEDVDITVMQNGTAPKNSEERQ